MANNKLNVIVIGAGSRGRAYTDIMADLPEKFKVVGVAEPIDDRREYIMTKHGVPAENAYTTWEDILNVPKFADVAIIATMDRMHRDPAMKALALGYDLLLEKPVAPTAEECAEIYNYAKKMGRKIMVCHVLRFTSYFRALKGIIDSGKLGEIISTGTIVNAEPSKEIIGNIFFHNAPLHDGATIIRGGRIYAAGCFLPLSQNYDISNMLGTRHRAALGISENSDAIAVVVSEETGKISMAVDGELMRELDPVYLKRKLEEYLIPEKTEPKVPKFFGKGGSEDK